jgi:hypothetical protein
MMTTPASAIKHEVRQLIDAQIEIFGQSSALTASQLQKYHERYERIRTLCEELDWMSIRSIRERQLRIAS